LGWITLDLLANSLLEKKRKGVYVRFFGSLYTRRTNAVLAAFAQFILALIASFFIYDLWTFIITIEISYLAPITIGTGVVLYLYILLGLPYTVRTWKRLGPAVVCLILAVLLAVLIYLFTR